MRFIIFAALIVLLVGCSNQHSYVYPAPPTDNTSSQGLPAEVKTLCDNIGTACDDAYVADTLQNDIGLQPQDYTSVCSHCGGIPGKLVYGVVQTSAGYVQWRSYWEEHSGGSGAGYVCARYIGQVPSAIVDKTHATICGNANDYRQECTDNVFCDTSKLPYNNTAALRTACMNTRADAVSISTEVGRNLRHGTLGQNCSFS